MSDEQLIRKLADKLGVSDMPRRPRAPEPEPYMVDARGVPFHLGPQTPPTYIQRGAPGVIHGRGEPEGKYFTDAVQIALGLKSAEGTLVGHHSAELIRAGFPVATAKSVLVPIDDNLYLVPGYEQALERVNKEFAQATPLRTLSHGQWAELHNRFATKAGEMTPWDDSAGGSLIPYPTRGELLGFWSAQQFLGAAGARAVPLPPGGIDWPSETDEATLTPLAPNQALSVQAVGTGSVKLMGKRFGTLVQLANDFLKFGTLAEPMVRQRLARAGARGEDQQFWTGRGGTLECQGLFLYPLSTAETATAGKVTLHVASTTGAAGDTFTVEDVNLMQSLVEEGNSPTGPSAWITTPRLFWILSNRRAGGSTASDGPFMFPVTRGAMGGEVQKILSGVPVRTSTLTPRDRVKGGASTLTCILLGDFSQCVVGRLPLEIVASEHAAFSADATQIRLIHRFDIVLLKPQGFVLCDTLLLA